MKKKLGQINESRARFQVHPKYRVLRFDFGFWRVHFLGYIQIKRRGE